MVFDASAKLFTKNIMDTSFKIDGRLIGRDHEPFIIAEMSGNHNQSLERALDIVDAAAKAGVDALKLQTYRADTITLKSDYREFQINDSESPWKGENLYELYEKAHTPWEWHAEIIRRANKHGMICFSSPFDETAVDFLESLDVKAYKIASFENNHLPLIRKAASTGKPLIISTGMASAGEIETAVQTARQAGCKDLALLKCTSTYPATPVESNIRTIPHLRELFRCEVGLSDHTMGIGVPLASIALGATIVEKHFTLSRDDGGVDSSFSLEPHELRVLVEESKRAWQALGRVNYQPTAKEIKSRELRRSVYVCSDIKCGEIFSSQNLKVVRPGYGLCPTMLDKVLGAKAKKSFKAGQPLTLEDLL